MLTDPDIAKFAYSQFSNKQMKYGIQIVVNRGLVMEGLIGSHHKSDTLFYPLDSRLIDSAKFVSQKMDMQILITSAVYHSLSATVRPFSEKSISSFLSVLDQNGISKIRQTGPVSQAIACERLWSRARAALETQNWKVLWLREENHWTEVAPIFRVLWRAAISPTNWRKQIQHDREHVSRN